MPQRRTASTAFCNSSYKVHVPSSGLSNALSCCWDSAKLLGISSTMLTMLCRLRREHARLTTCGRLSPGCRRDP